MKRLFCALILFTSFVSYAAENKPTSSLGGGRKINLGYTGSDQPKTQKFSLAEQVSRRNSNQTPRNIISQENSGKHPAKK